MIEIALIFAGFLAGFILATVIWRFVWMEFTRIQDRKDNEYAGLYQLIRQVEKSIINTAPAIRDVLNEFRSEIRKSAKTTPSEEPLFMDDGDGGTYLDYEHDPLGGDLSGPPTRDRSGV